MTDLRNTSMNSRTKKLFKKSFIKLINKKGYSKVTIKDIVEDAGFNRTTFYLYYEDKNAITKDLMEEMYAGFMESCYVDYPKNQWISAESLSENAFSLFYYIKENRDFFDLLLMQDTLPKIHDFSPSGIFEVLNKYFEMKFNVHTNLRAHLINHYMAYGTAGLIIDWIKNDYKKTTNEITKEMIELFQVFVHSFLIRS